MYSETVCVLLNWSARMTPSVGWWAVLCILVGIISAPTAQRNYAVFRSSSTTELCCLHLLQRVSALFCLFTQNAHSCGSAFNETDA